MRYGYGGRVSRTSPMAESASSLSATYGASLSVLKLDEWSVDWQKTDDGFLYLNNLVRGSGHGSLGWRSCRSYATLLLECLLSCHYRVRTIAAFNLLAILCRTWRRRSRS